MTRSLLAYCPGYPFATESLMPRRLLGELAAALHQSGHEARVVDGGTLSAWAHAYGSACAVSLDASGSAGDGRWRIRRAHARAGAALAAGHARLVSVVFDDLVSRGPFGLAIIEVDRHEDVAPSLALAARIRSHDPDAKLLAVGRAAPWHADLLLRTGSPFDAVCRGDAEGVAPAVAARLDGQRDWRVLPGLILREADGRLAATAPPPYAPPEEWPEPLYEPAVYPAAHGPDKLRVYPIAESRGGDLGGHGLPRPPLEQRQVRVRSAERVCGEVAALARSTGARAFHFTGAGTPSAQLDALAYEILARCLHIRYSRAGHVRNLDALTIGTLRTSGCQALALPVDSGSQRLLTDFYGHGFGVSETIQLARACARAGVFVQMHFTYPCPADDFHTRAESLRLARCAGPASVTVGFPAVVPGSAWHEHAPAFGYRASARNGCAPAAIPAFRGVRSAATVRAHAEFREALAADGHVLDAGAVEALLGRMAAGPGREVDFALRWRRALQYVDVKALRALAGEFNACAVLPVNTVAFPGPVSIRAVVGN